MNLIFLNGLAGGDPDAFWEMREEDDVLRVLKRQLFKYSAVQGGGGYGHLVR